MNLFFFAATIIALWIYLRLSYRFHWFDRPDEDRKIHSHAKPTSAGLVFMVPVIAYLILQHQSFSLLLILLTVMVAIGAIDDFINLSVVLRLITALAVCALTVIYHFNTDLYHWGLLLFYIISLSWWVNLYNFMDGADGMAALHAIVALSCYLFLFWGSDLQPLITLLIVVLFSFLLFNFPHSRMFMGDSGSLGVSFLIGWIAFKGIESNRFGEILVFSVHLAFIIDATLTFFMRWFNKHSISSAHNLHLFQSLIYHGMKHYKVSVLYAIATSITSTVALLMFQYQLSWIHQILVVSTEALILMIIWFKFTDLKRFQKK